LLGTLAATLRGRAASLDLGDILADGDGVFLIGEKLLDGTGLRGVDGDIDLEKITWLAKSKSV
jgi:hypothetical protein